MPTSGMVREMIIEEEVARRIVSSFSGELARQDARRLWRLVRRGLDYSFYLFFTGAYGLIMTAIPLFAGRYFFAVAIGVSVGIFMGYLWSERRHARQEIGMLLGSDPMYWIPIWKQLKTIVAGAQKKARWP